MISYPDFYKNVWVVEHGQTGMPAHPEVTDDLYNILSILFDPQPLAQTMLLGLPKKVGKSVIMASYLVYRQLKAIADGRPSSLHLISSNSKEHGQDVLRQAVEYGLKGMPDLAGLFAVNRDEIILTDDETDFTSSIRILSRGDSAVSGINYGAGVCAVDELWGIRKTDVKAVNRWSELQPPPGNPETVRLCASYAGLQNSIILKELWTKLVSGTRVTPDYPIFKSANGAIAGIIDDGYDRRYYTRPHWQTDEWIENEYKDTVNKAGFERQFFLKWSVSDGQLAVAEADWTSLKDIELEYVEG